MKDKIVAILETRTGEHMGTLVARRGGIPVLAPALEEIPDIEPAAALALLETWRIEPYRMVIFQTGVGTRALFHAIDSLGRTEEFATRLARTLVVARGPKPIGELNARNIRIDIRAPSPFTTETVLAAITSIDVDHARVLVQRYGATNAGLCEALRARGARVEEITTYQWSLPANVKPLEDLLDGLAGTRIDAVVFTSAVQIQNLYHVAETLGRSNALATQLNEVVVASIGPVCSRALRARGIEPTFEANPPKLGPLMVALEAALAAAAPAVDP